MIRRRVAELKIQAHTEVTHDYQCNSAGMYIFRRLSRGVDVKLGEDCVTLMRTHLYEL